MFKNLALARLLAGILVSSPTFAANKIGQFDVLGNYSGAPSNLTLSLTIQPAPGDAGQHGQDYVAAMAGNNLLLLTPSGWVPSTAGVPPYSQGPLGTQTISVLSSFDVSSLECAQVLGGYGLNLTDMLSNNTYKVAYQVPAQWPRTTPLPCSSMTDSDVVRFLEQATFGPTQNDINLVKSEGMAAWIANQFALPATTYPVLPAVPNSLPTSCTGTCPRDEYSMFPLQIAFFQNALNAPDQLRQRVAFALSQILVVSGNTVSPTYGMTAYQNLLINGAFGNYEDLLTNVTLSPVMGRYLDMANNGKPQSATQQANENYARELMQLFSIGVNQLNQDGSVITNSNGLPVPAYTEDTIKAFALALTGWTYPATPGLTSSIYNPVYYLGTMTPVDSNHDQSQKVLLNGVTLPGGQTSQQDLTTAIHTVFMHPNVGPFIGRQLIEHLVTSNPSPAYISRVAAVFANNGQGVRGDLKAVIRAILLDPEARGSLPTSTTYGHLKEPALFMTHLMRALGTTTDGVWPNTQIPGMSQNLYFPDTVFSYYPPNNTLVSGATAPEFAIYNASTALARASFVYALVFSSAANNIPMPAKPDPTVTNSVGTFTNLGPLVNLASNPPALIDQLNILLLHGSMTPEMRTELINQMTAASGNPLVQTQTAIFLTATSSLFQVER